MIDKDILSSIESFREECDPRWETSEAMNASHKVEGSSFQQ
jgi:hypothetical protein